MHSLILPVIMSSRGVSSGILLKSCSAWASEAVSPYPWVGGSPPGLATARAWLSVHWTSEAPTLASPSLHFLHISDFGHLKLFRISQHLWVSCTWRSASNFKGASQEKRTVVVPLGLAGCEPSKRSKSLGCNCLRSQFHLALRCAISSLECEKTGWNGG